MEVDAPLGHAKSSRGPRVTEHIATTFTAVVILALVVRHEAGQIRCVLAAARLRDSQQIEEGFMTVQEALDGIKAKAAEEHAEVTAAFGRLDTSLQQLKDQLAAAGTLTPDQQAEVDGTINDMQAEIDAAKGEG